MRILTSTLTAAALAAGTFGSFAQGNFDFFASPKTVVVQPPTVLTQSSTNSLLTTNIIPVGRFLGIIALDIFSVSNSVGASGNAVYNGTNGFQLYSSSTGTNGWSPITNGLFATPTSLVQSNYWGITNNQVAYFTNTFMVPGTLTYATVGTSGYSGQYVIPPTPTPSSVTSSSGISTNWTVGFDIDNAGTFLQIVWTTTGSNSVYGVGAVMRGRTKAGQY